MPPSSRSTCKGTVPRQYDPQVCFSAQKDLKQEAKTTQDQQEPVYLNGRSLLVGQRDLSRRHESLTHLQPAACDRKPPIIGPMTGPSRGPNAKNAVAVPRSLDSNKSDTIPPPMDRHAEPPSPAKRRNIRSVVMLGATAQANCHMTKIAVAMSRI